MLVSSYSELEISVDGESVQNWSLHAGKNCTTIAAAPFNKTSPTTFSLKAISTAQIDELKLFGFTKKLGLYDANGKPAAHLEAYRQLNSLIKD